MGLNSLKIFHMQIGRFNQHGWLEQAQPIVSPNYDARPESCAVDMVVIHNISLPPGEYGGEGIIQLFTNQLKPDEHAYYAQICHLRVSSHFLIRRDGHLIQLVSCDDRAWHAGASHWKGREHCNDFSIGIEIEGSDHEAFESTQYVTLNFLLGALKAHFPIEHIVGHSDIAPDRKTDPGPYFDWNMISPL